MSSTCKYCHYFAHPIKRNHKKGVRRCGVTRKWIESDSKSCQELLVRDYFWCNKNSQWKKFAQCLDQREQFEGCGTCRQFDSEVSELMVEMINESAKLRQEKKKKFIKEGFTKKRKRKVIKRKGRKIIKRNGGGSKKNRKIIRRSKNAEKRK